MAKVPLVFHDRYDLHLGRHVFPSRKYRLIREALLAEGSATPEDFIEPTAASQEELCLVHDARWLEKLQRATISYQEVQKLEIPYSRPMVEGFWLAAGGSILAARLALKHGIAYNVGGGFHHAFAAHGEGFCAINDIAVAARVLQREGLVRRVLVVDCDVHQGNGTAAIFANDSSVFTLSIHQLNNYPTEKPPSNLDVNLEDGLGDADYLSRLRAAYVPALELVRPDLIFYVAGADPYREDRLGGLNLSKEGLMERDRLVLERALEHKAPVCITLAGGYALQIEDTVDIHANTWRTANKVRERCRWPSSPEATSAPDPTSAKEL